MCKGRMTMVIETINLTKTYHGQGGCKNICLSVSEGQVFGFLGPNGAGKSTLIKTLLTILTPTSGEAFLLGKPLGNLEARRKIGFLPENFRYHEWMTGSEILKFHGDLYGLTPDALKKKMPEVLSLVNLTGYEKQKIGTYSKGMQQRIGLACALLPEPKLLFLDEPTSALDPLGRKEVRDIILNLKNQGTTVFLNSHLLSEVEHVCDEVAIIKKGNIITNGKLQDLLKEQLEVNLEIDNLTSTLLEKISNFATLTKLEGNKVNVKLREKSDLPTLSKLIIDEGGLLYELSSKNSLEELFLHLVKGDEQ
jgi:ABC-2 type transport system ATP-binding protein